MTDSVETVCTEGAAFFERNRERLAGNPMAGAGSLVWGLLRALYECPSCPGQFRVPVRREESSDGPRAVVDPSGEYLVCSACGGVWVFAGPAGDGASPEAGLGWRAPMRQKAPGEEADQDDR